MKKQIVGLTLGLGLVGRALAATVSYTFSGSVSADWFTYGNWTTSGSSDYPCAAEGNNGDDAVFPPNRTVDFDRDGTTAANVPEEVFIRMIQAGSSNSTEPVVINIKSGTLTTTSLCRLGRNNCPVQVNQTGGTFRSVSTSTAVDAFCLAYETTSADIWCEYTLDDGWLDLSAATKVALTIGQSGNGRVTINGGKADVTADVTLGHNASANGELIVTGGELNIGNRLRTSRTGTSRTVLSGGTVKVVNQVEVGKLATFTLGGTARLETSHLRDGSYTAGAGGTLLFDGGTLVKTGAATADFIGAALQQVYVGAHATTVEIAEGDSAVVAVPLVPSPALAEGVTDGGLVKTGAGTLQLCAGTTIQGKISVNAGTLVVSPTDALDIEVAEGATLEYSIPEVFTASVTISSDLLARMKAEATDNELVINVGDNAEVLVPDAFTLDEGWTLRKLGNGTLVLRGANAWTGNVVLEGGLLVAELGVGLPATAHVVFANGAWAPLVESFTWTRGEGAGSFSVSDGCGLSLSAREKDLVIDFGGAGAEFPLTNDLYLNPRNADHAITVRNPLKGDRAVYACANDIVFLGDIDTQTSLTTRDTAHVTLPPAFSAKQINAPHQSNAVSTLDLDGGSVTIIDSGFVNPFILAGQADITGEQATFNFKAGTFTVLDGNNSTLGRGTNARGVFNQTGGAASFVSSVVLGENGTGVYSQSAGTLAVGVNATLAQNANATGELTVTGTGVTTVNGAVRMAGGSGATARVTVTNGGVLEAGSFVKLNAAGAATLVVDGGTLRVVGSQLTLDGFLKAFDSVEIGANGLYLDVGDNNLTDAFGGTVVLNGPIVKRGTGSLSLAANMADGNILVEEGTVQVLPSSLVDGPLGRNRWTFDGTFEDSIGGATAVPVGEAIAFDEETGSVVLSGKGKRTNYLDLTAAVFTESVPATFEFWATLDADAPTVISGYNGKIFCYGDTSAKSIFINYSGGVKCGGKFQSGQLGTMIDGQLWHYSIVVTPQGDGKSKVTFRRKNADGVTLGKYEETQTIDLATNNTAWWLGDGSFAAENDMLGSFREVRVWKKALSDAELIASCKAGPDAPPSGFLPARTVFNVKAGGTVSLAGTLDPANYAIAFADDADTIASYLKANGGTWTLVRSADELTAEKLPTLPDLRAYKVRAELQDNELRVRLALGTCVLLR